MKELEKKILDYMTAHKEDMIADLSALVKAESHTCEKEHADQCARELARLYRERLAAESRFDPQTEVGDNVITEIGQGERKLLIVGHYDTVHPYGTVPLRRDGEILYGPGVTDMKGGDVMVIWALKALKDLGVDLNKRVTVVNNSDEETGSHHSRPLLLKEAEDAFACIVAEPSATERGLIKTCRKGGGSVTIRCRGKASHSGSAPAAGVNANIELAHQIIFVEGLSNYGPGGTTFSANIIRGGEVSNVVCDYAEARVDWRMCIPSEVERCKKIFEERGPVLPGASVEFDVRVGHMPMEDNEANRGMFARLAETAKDLDMTVEAAPMVGGCSDGNDISASGVPTIDGMGVVGSGMHTPGEKLFLEHLAPRAALMAAFIARL